MQVFYYIDVRGIKQGSTNEHKIQMMGKRAWATRFGQCDIADFFGQFHNSEWH